MLYHFAIVCENKSLNDLDVVYNNINKIIYNDFLPSPRRGSLASSQITHPQSSNIHPFAHVLDTCASIFGS